MASSEFNAMYVEFNAIYVEFKWGNITLYPRFLDHIYKIPIEEIKEMCEQFHGPTVGMRLLSLLKNLRTPGISAADTG